MALSGVHILCGRVAARSGATLPIYPDWSETLASPGTTTNAGVDASTLFSVSAGVDAYFAVGKAPDAGQAVGTKESARYFVAAGATREVFGVVGDKVAWVAA